MGLKLFTFVWSPCLRICEIFAVYHFLGTIALENDELCMKVSSRTRTRNASLRTMADKLSVADDLRLYSTATQNTWRRGLALGSAPDARILHWRYQHVGIFWCYLTLKFASPPTPNPNAIQWNIICIGYLALGLALAMYISFFLCPFHLRCIAYFQWNMGFRGVNIFYCIEYIFFIYNHWLHFTSGTLPSNEQGMTNLDARLGLMLAKNVFI